MTEVRTGIESISTGREEQVHLLLHLVQEINSGATLESVFSLVAGALRQVFDIDRFAIVLVQSDGSYRSEQERRPLRDLSADRARAHTRGERSARPGTAETALHSRCTREPGVLAASGRSTG